MHANFSNLQGVPVGRMGRPPRTLSRAWRQVLPRRPGGTQPRNTPQQHLTVRQTDETDVNMPDTCNRCPENGGQPSQPVVSSTNGNPTTSSYNSPGRGPRFSDPATHLQQGTGWRHARTRPPASLSSPASRIHKGPGKGPGQIRGTCGRADNHKNVNEPPARVLPSRASIWR